MNDNIKFEIKAEAFHKMTGILAPGKDDRVGSHSYEDRASAWERWNDENYQVVRAMITATEHILG